MTMTRFDRKNEAAVSPVVGVMMMLVVVIIIAAIVSSFAGGMMNTQKKVPQASIQGKFSVSGGMEISHAGGDPIALHEVNFVIRDNSVFGPNVQQMTTQVLDKTNITDSNGQPIVNSDGTINIASFTSGDTLFIDAANSTCDILQPMVAPTPGVSGSDYTGTDHTHWNLCIRNPDSIGKTFTLEVDDKQGNMISRSDVIISA